MTILDTLPPLTLSTGDVYYEDIIDSFGQPRTAMAYSREEAERVIRERDRIVAEHVVRACAEAFLREAETWAQLEKAHLLGSVKRQGSKAILALLEKP